jgi:hypothetical protein
MIGGQAPQDRSEGFGAKTSRGIELECHPEEMAF